MIYKFKIFPNYMKYLSLQFISELAITFLWQNIFPKNYEKAFAYKEISWMDWPFPVCDTLLTEMY